MAQRRRQEFRRVWGSQSSLVQEVAPESDVKVAMLHSTALDFLLRKVTFIHLFLHSHSQTLNPGLYFLGSCRRRPVSDLFPLSFSLCTLKPAKTFQNTLLMPCSGSLYNLHYCLNKVLHKCLHLTFKDPCVLVLELLFQPFLLQSFTWTLFDSILHEQPRGTQALSL